MSQQTPESCHRCCCHSVLATNTWMPQHLTLEGPSSIHPCRSITFGLIVGYEQHSTRQSCKIATTPRPLHQLLELLTADLTSCISQCIEFYQIFCWKVVYIELNFPCDEGIYAVRDVLPQVITICVDAKLYGGCSGLHQDGNFFLSNVTVITHCNCAKATQIAL